MVATTHQRSSHVDAATVILRVIVVTLALATAAIHATLGGTLFMLNAIGYTVLAGAMVLPGPFGRIRSLTRIALIGFTGATIAGWWLFGARFDLAYLDKAIELALVAVLAVELWRIDGGPLTLARRLRREATHLMRARVRVS